MGKEESTNTKIAVMANDIAFIKGSISDINESLKNNFVRKDTFEPVRLIAYGLVALLLIALVTAIAGTVIIHPWTSTVTTTATVPLK